MLTLSQRRFIATAFAAVSAALDTVSFPKDLVVRLLNKCGGSQPEARALWWLGIYLTKPSRIPAHFGSLLRMSEDQVFAAAVVSEHGELLRGVLTQRHIDRLNNIEFNATA